MGLADYLMFVSKGRKKSGKTFCVLTIACNAGSHSSSSSGFKDLFPAGR